MIKFDVPKCWNSELNITAHRNPVPEKLLIRAIERVTADNTRQFALVLSFRLNLSAAAIVVMVHPKSINAGSSWHRSRQPYIVGIIVATQNPALALRLPISLRFACISVTCTRPKRSTSARMESGILILMML